MQNQDRFHVRIRRKHTICTHKNDEKKKKKKKKERKKVRKKKRHILKRVVQPETGFARDIMYEILM